MALFDLQNKYTRAAAPVHVPAGFLLISPPIVSIHTRHCV